MPARSKAQATAARIAEHAPEKLYARNQGLAEMKPSALHEYAATTSKGLPRHVPKAKAGNRYDQLRKR